MLQLETIAQLRAQSVEVLLYSASRLSAYDEGYGTLFAYHLPSFVHAMHDDDWVIVAHPNEYAISHAHFNGERDYATATVHLYDFDEPADQVAKASMKTQSKPILFPTQPNQYKPVECALLGMASASTCTPGTYPIAYHISAPGCQCVSVQSQTGPSPVSGVLTFANERRIASP